MSEIIYTKEVLENAVKNSNYFTEVLEFLGACRGGNTYQRIKSLIKKYEIDTSHFLKGYQKGFQNSKIAEKKTWQEILVYNENSSNRIASYMIRRALIESGRDYVCEICNLEPIWNDQELTLHVDHKDGDWKDSRKENIRFLCPNCHSQQLTSYNKNTANKCDNCNKKITKKSKWCQRCFGKFVNRKRKVEERPDLETLKKEVENLGYVGTGKKYGVTDNAIRKWIKTAEKNKLFKDNGCG